MNKLTTENGDLQKSRPRLCHPLNMLFYSAFLIGCSVQTALVVHNYFRYEMVVAVRLDNGPLSALPGVTFTSEFLPFINHTRFVAQYPPTKNQSGSAHRNDEPREERTPDFNVLSFHRKETLDHEPNTFGPARSNSVHSGFRSSNSHRNNTSEHNSTHLDFDTFDREIAARVEVIRNASITLDSLMDLLIDPQQLFKNCFLFDVNGANWRRCLEVTRPVVTAEQRRTDIQMHRTVYYTLFADEIDSKQNLSVYNFTSSTLAASKSSSGRSFCNQAASKLTDHRHSINESGRSSTGSEKATGQDDLIDRTSIYSTNSLMRLPASESFVAHASNRGSNRLMSIKLSLPFLDEIDRGFGIRIVLHHPQLPPNARTASKIGIVYRKHGWYALKYTHSSAQLLPSPFASDCRSYRKLGFVNKRHCVDACVKQASIRQCNSIAFFTCLTRADLQYGPFRHAIQCADAQKCLFATRLLEQCEERCAKEDCEWHVYDANIALQTSHEQPYLLVELMKPLAGLNQIYEYRAAIKPLDVFIYIGGTVGMWFGVSLLSCYQQAARRLLRHRRRHHCRSATVRPMVESTKKGDTPLAFKVTNELTRTISGRTDHYNKDVQRNCFAKYEHAQFNYYPSQSLPVAPFDRPFRYRPPV